MRKILVLLLAIVFTTTCSVQAAQLNKVAAVVNGQVITMFDLQKNALPDIIRSGLNPENPANAKQVDTVFRKVLDLMIMDILIAQEAKRLKVSISPSEIDNEIAKLMQGRNMTKQQFEEQLTRQKSSVAELRGNIEKTLLRQKIMSMEVGRRVLVTPEEIKAYYEAHKNTMYDRTGLHMALLVYHPNANAAALAAAADPNAAGALTDGAARSTQAQAPGATPTPPRSRGCVFGRCATFLLPCSTPSTPTISPCCASCTSRQTCPST